MNYKNTKDPLINGEEWRPVAGWEHLYHVSNFGRVKSLDRQANNPHGTTSFIKGRILRQFIRKRYLTVNLCYSNNRICALVHRLVATAFNENPNSFPVINHKDFNPLNNHESNIEWCTISHNTQHAWDNDRFRFSKLYKANR